MKTYSLLVVAMALSVAYLDGGESAPVAPEYAAEAPTYHPLKRSLCNTFGGCGSKRSLGANFSKKSDNNVASDDSFGILTSYPTIRSSMPSAGTPKIEELAKMNDPIADALNNLLEYLDRDERFKSGKYVISVPRVYPDETILSQRASSESNPDSGAFFHEFGARAPRRENGE